MMFITERRRSAILLGVASDPEEQLRRCVNPTTLKGQAYLVLRFAKHNTYKVNLSFQ